MASDLRRLPDPDLLSLIWRGDLDALEVVYDRHVEAAWRVALTFSASALSARLLSSVWREAARGSASPIPPH